MYFQKDLRLNIELPHFPRPFEELALAEREEILAEWAGIRAQIPNRVKEFEREIQQLLDMIHHEDDWETVTHHFAEISDLASRINELNLWSRVDPDVHEPTSEDSIHRSYLH